MHSVIRIDTVRDHFYVMQLGLIRNFAAVLRYQMAAKLRKHLVILRCEILLLNIYSKFHIVKIPSCDGLAPYSVKSRRHHCIIGGADFSKKFKFRKSVW
jgi:hypothetical protein